MILVNVTDARRPVRIVIPGQSLIADGTGDRVRHLDGFVINDGDYVGTHWTSPGVANARAPPVVLPDVEEISGRAVMVPGAESAVEPDPVVIEARVPATVRRYHDRTAVNPGTAVGHTRTGHWRVRQRMRGLVVVSMLRTHMSPRSGRKV